MRFPGIGHIIGIGLVLLLILGGCAEITKPRPSRQEIEAVELTALTRQPHISNKKERAMRVFLRLLPTLPRSQGGAYPFLGFTWWVTATGQPVVDHVWEPSPAQDRPLRRQITALPDPRYDQPPPLDQEAALKQGDLILAVNGMSIPTWVRDWDRVIRDLRDVFRSSLPGAVLADLVLTWRHGREAAAGRYQGGPVTLEIDRQGSRRQVTLFPIYLPAEYGLLLVAGHPDQAYSAYAAPGRVLITRNLLDMCRTEDELAVLLGHELAHQALGHLVRQEGQRQLVVTAAEIIALPFRVFWTGAPWYYGVSEDVRRAAGSAMISVFSRQDEREADAYGLWYAYQAGFEVEQGAYIWERLAAVVHQDVLATTRYLDSHPPAAERLARLRKLARLFREGQAAQVFALDGR